MSAGTRSAGPARSSGQEGPADRARAARPGLVLGICCSALFLSVADASIVHVVLPSVQADLGGSVTALQWVVDSYLLVLASLLIFAGSVADRWGRRRVFVAGLAVFAFGTTLCGLAGSIELLVAARVLQAVGAAMLNPVALGIIADVYPPGAARARALGTWSAVSGLGIAAGPPLGGVVAATVGWRGVFLVTVPVALAALALALRYVPESRAAEPRRIDPVGQVLLVALVGGTVAVLIEGPTRGWTSAYVVAPAALVAVGVLLFVRVELRHPAPLVDPRLFRSRQMVAAVGSAVAGFAAFGGCLFALSLTLQSGRGLDPLTTGLVVLPLGLAALAVSSASARLVGRGRARAALLLAGVLLAAGSLALGVAEARTVPLVVVAAAVALFGLG
ncbi:MAG TPA: MFS transporter, partial [Nocardioides sp.]